MLLSLFSGKGRLSLTAVLLIGGVIASPARQSAADTAAVAHAMRWRLIGPFRSGRISAVAGVAGDPATYYIGGPGGGVWKSTDGGTVWTPIFDQTGEDSIGAIAVAPSRPSTVYVGTGDVSNVGGSVNQGHGVYKSSDAGTSWQAIGLADTRHIAAILVSPTDPDLVLVAALGHTYARNDERGIFRSGDGGAHWTKALFVDDQTGACSLVADPDGSPVVYAAFESHSPSSGRGRGRGSAPPLAAAIYRSQDEGQTWQPVGGRGLPAGDLGRIGLAVVPATKGQGLLAIVSGRAGGLFRSDDAGQSWARTTTDPRIVGSSYFSEVYLAPGDPQTVYVMQTSLYRSLDGGKTFSAYKGAPGGDDYHVLWIDPRNPSRMIVGVDQGVTISRDAGRTWNLGWYGLANGQFYHLSTDNRQPYWVYGTEQDSGSAAVASRGDFGAITFMDWRPSVGAYESGYIFPDPLDPNLVFANGSGSSINRYDWATKQVFDVSPPRANHRFAGAPSAFSPQDPHTFYLGAEVLLRTTDRGRNWQPISPDLGVNLGGARTSPDGGPAEGAISALAPSPARSGEIWAGTSNGLVQLTVDGKSWKTVTPPGLPSTGIASIEASPTDPATAYVVFERHASNDFAPHILRTRDFGRSWQAIVNGLPADRLARVVREDPAQPGLLYAGTEHGVYVSFDGGDQWRSLQLNLPPASVRDLTVHGNDLVAATFGRALWILDDLAPLRQQKVAGASAPYLFAPEPALRMRFDVNFDTPFPPEMPVGANPPDGAIVDYRLPDGVGPGGPVRLQIHDAAGALVRELSSAPLPPEPEPRLDIPNYWLARPQPLPADAGMNRAVWDLRYPPPPALRRDYPISAIVGATPAEPLGPLALPGDYEVRLLAAGRTLRQPLRVVMDPRAQARPADLRAQLELGLAISAAMGASFEANRQLDQVETTVGAVPAELDLGARRAPLTSLAARLRAYAAVAGRGRGGNGSANVFAAANVSLGTLLNNVEQADQPPTSAMAGDFGGTCRSLSRALANWEQEKAQDVRFLASIAALAHLPALSALPAITAPRCGSPDVTGPRRP